MTKDYPNSRTIEFRQPTDSSTIEEALIWLQLATNFVSAALLSATLINRTHTPTLDEFCRFRKEGSSLTRNINQNATDRLLTGKEKMNEGPLEEESLSAEDLDLERAKERRGSMAKQELEAALMEFSFDELLDNGDS